MRSTACIFLIVVYPSFGWGIRASSSSSEVFQVFLRAFLSAWSPSWEEPSVMIFSLVLTMAKRVGLNSTDPSSYENDNWNVRVTIFWFCHRMVGKVPGLGCWGKGDDERQGELDIRLPSPMEGGYAWNLFIRLPCLPRKPEQWKQLRLWEFSLANRVKLPPRSHKVTLLIVWHFSFG